MAAARRHCPSWADLQPELVGLVLRRLPSLADRVRLAAVCRPWRGSAQLEPDVPPPFPWLTLRDGTFLSIPDGGKIYCLPSVPPAPGGNSRCLGSVANNWLLFLEQHTGDGGSLLSLMNPFSMDVVVQLPDADTICRRSPCVLLASSMDLSPDDPLFAVLVVVTDDCMFESVISICQPSSSTAAASALFRVPGHERICDVAFVDGKLYALTPRKLFVLEVE